EETGIAFADAEIRSNTVTLAGKGFGFRLRGVNGLEASSNDIYMEQAVQTAAGIRVNGATNCTIRENYVVGPGPDNLFFVGLDVLDGSSSVFDCNTFTELGTGAEFEGSCMGSTVSTNVFEPGTLGLGRGLVYRNSLNIGVQSHAGNLWEVNMELPNEGYEVAAAVSFGSGLDDLTDNSYPVHDEDPPIRPSSFTFPNIGGIPLQTLINFWFPVDPEGEAGICIPGGVVEPGGPKDIHRQVARGELQDSLYGEALLWVAQLQLYRQLSKAIEWPSDEIQDSFYLANANTAISQYYLLEKAKEALFHYDSLQGATLNGWEAQLQELIGYILEKDSLIAAGTLGMEASRDSLLGEASTLCISLDSLENVLLQSQLALAQQAITDNASLTDTAVYQSNEINRVGQALLERRLSPEENRHTIQLPHLPEGLYFLKVYRNETLISLHKLVVLN
ncbi:MAG: right-handed parallel beta-helix repeat-containing protein, partial [Phaeodactylibacter sp.]|nr:right-handed parallel beta-helix repeat-containing protein [Phaeodactylibacter sp.]